MQNVSRFASPVQIGVLALFALLMSVQATAGTNADFNAIVTQLTDWMEGSLGTVFALGATAVGLGAGIAKGSAMAVVVGLGVALSTYFGPAILTGLATAGLPL